MGFPGDASGKEATCKAGDTRDMGSILRSGGFPGEEKGNPLQYSCLGNTKDRGAWWATVHGVAVRNNGAHTHTHTHTHTLTTEMENGVSHTFDHSFTQQLFISIKYFFSLLGQTLSFSNPMCRCHGLTSFILPHCNVIRQIMPAIISVHLPEKMHQQMSAFHFSS